VFKALHRKLVAVLVFFAITMALMFLVVTRHLDTMRSQELHQKLYRTLASQLVQDQLLPESENLDSLRIQQVFDRLRVINPRIDVYLLDDDGKIVASSVRTRIIRNTVDLGPIRKFLDEKADLPIHGDDPTEAMRQRVFSAAPISITRQVDGYLYLIMRGLTSDSIAERVKSSHTLRESIWFIMWGLIFALIAGALVLRFMTRPLRQLTAVMDKFQQSGFAVQVAKTPPAPQIARDEVNQLTDTFNAMVDRMLAQMRELKSTDATRRELVANISHDLRTPLASLQGYLETLHVKGDMLSAAEKRNYLEIALRQSGQLSHLINELFELAKLDSDQATILPEPFMLEDLVQDVIQQFELEATRKGIELRADMPVELPLVAGDIGLIERVLRNLIDNSLRHTPAGGVIMVALTPGEQRVTVEVTDSGTGIDTNDLPHIFDRFYRADKSRGDCQRNAGLGLAIAKRILELHGAAISVSSKPGKTVIAFSLAYADKTSSQTQHTEPAGADMQQPESDFSGCPGAFPLYAPVNEDLRAWAKRELGAPGRAAVSIAASKQPLCKSTV